MANDELTTYKAKRNCRRRTRSVSELHRERPDAGTLAASAILVSAADLLAFKSDRDFAAWLYRARASAFEPSTGGHGLRVPTTLWFPPDNIAFALGDAETADLVDAVDLSLTDYDAVASRPLGRVKRLIDPTQQIAGVQLSHPEARSDRVR
jgi:hypothetical protein